MSTTKRVKEERRGKDEGGEDKDVSFRSSTSIESTYTSVKTMGKYIGIVTYNKTYKHLNRLVILTTKKILS